MFDVINKILNGIVSIAGEFFNTANISGFTSNNSL